MTAYASTHRDSAPKVSHPHDPAEREAERTADSVMRSLPAGPESRSTTGSSGGGLDAATRRRFEPHFGDLSAVRIRADHTAATQARRLNANAFTIGNTISFASGKFAPGSAAGQRLLAHEIAHVTSPRSNAGVIHRDLAGYTREHLDVMPNPSLGMGMSSPTMDVTSADAAALASALAALITAGKIGTGTHGDLQGFWSTGATQADVEAAFTAAGFPKARDMAVTLLDGTRSAVYSRNEKVYVPGIIWDTTLLETKQNVSVRTTRGLTNAEKVAAQSVFGNSLNYDAIVLDEAPVMAIGGYARTTPWTINFPVGTLSGGLSITWLIHEMGHSWEYAQGVSMLTTLRHAIRGVYDYGGEAELAKRTAAGQGLRSFNTEQQADIAKDAYLALNGSGTLSVFLPYIAEFHSGYHP
ncbi:DUF4157 domain-containing protein [Kutzneria sp. NPDC052558]|uniref:DUF4157 domain-containing protein n=1 Tax=Kutzneria sp. NPDC052558 TaxID=3364121 RepID=UPI0037C5E33A